MPYLCSTSSTYRFGCEAAIQQMHHTRTTVVHRKLYEVDNGVSLHQSALQSMLNVQPTLFGQFPSRAETQDLADPCCAAAGRTVAKHQSGAALTCLRMLLALPLGISEHSPERSGQANTKPLCAFCGILKRRRSCSASQLCLRFLLFWRVR